MSKPKLVKDNQESLRLSIVGFNGSKNCDKTSPESFLASYIANKAGIGDQGALLRVKQNQQWIMEIIRDLLHKKPKPSSPNPPVQSLGTPEQKLMEVVTQALKTYQMEVGPIAKNADLQTPSKQAKLSARIDHPDFKRIRVELFSFCSSSAADFTGSSKFLWSFVNEMKATEQYEMVSIIEQNPAYAQKMAKVCVLKQQAATA